MISKKLAKALKEQVGHELGASQIYLGMAAYFGLQDLEKWADIFHKQSVEERGHAMKIIQFLIDVDAAFTLPAVSEAPTTYDSAMEVIQSALKNEQLVTKQFQTMAQMALDEKDFTSFQFLQWFIEEQVEEEATMRKYESLLKSDPDPFRAEMIVAELEDHAT
ncbi:MAG: ferritin [Armatimonadetes bacterium]|nr:ferritin [Armatimonadota bacterium]